MKKTGAELVVYALEQIGVTHTFGIPGVHNIELYDELNNSQQITPILTTHENGATFMADAVSRVSDSIGVAMIVPAAGMTNGMSGIGEAYLDGIPSLIISGGVRRDSGKHYQLHQLDQSQILSGITKGFFLIQSHEEIVETVYKAYDLAISGEPGPVFIEVPAELQLFKGEVSSLPVYQTRKFSPQELDDKVLEEVVSLLNQAKKPGLYLGWGAVPAENEVVKLADQLGTPVATTLQGLSAFPAKHPLHVGVGFGPSSLPAAQKAFEDCDVLLAIGCRFGELATGSYGLPVPEKLIHVDINPDVFDKNYPATVSVISDSRDFLRALLSKDDLRRRDVNPNLIEQIKKQKEAYRHDWNESSKSGLVSPGLFFKSLKEKLNDDAFIVVDDGKHTFLTAELMPINQARHFISPTDFNCMGYCVPASIGTKLKHPTKQVVGIVGDGAFLMTGLELLTAVTYGLGVMMFVFHDGELGQISQFQKVPLNRKTCTVLGQLQVKGVADAVGCEFVSLEKDDQIESAIQQAIELSNQGKTVLIDVKIDYSRKTMLTKGVLKTNLGRFPLKEKMRFIGRALKRHLLD